MMRRSGVNMARCICRFISKNLIVSLSPVTVHTLNGSPFKGPLNRASFNTSNLTTVGFSWPFSQPRDLSLPNSSWGTEMMRLYDHYNSQCEIELDGGEKKTGPWKRLPSYNRSLKYATGGVYLSKVIQSKSCFFTRNIKVPGAAFEYVMFVNKEEHRSVCLFQAGHLLEGPPGHVHGGAIATMIDTVTGIHATYLSGPVMTANLNINYRSPIRLGSTVLLESFLEKKEGRKTWVSCKLTSTDGSKIHTEGTGLFVSITVSQLLGE